MVGVCVGGFALRGWVCDFMVPSGCGWWVCMMWSLRCAGMIWFAYVCVTDVCGS